MNLKEAIDKDKLDQFIAEHPEVKGDMEAYNQFLMGIQALGQTDTLLKAKNEVPGPQYGVIVDVVFDQAMRQLAKVFPKIEEPEVKAEINRQAGEAWKARQAEKEAKAKCKKVA